MLIKWWSTYIYVFLAMALTVVLSACGGGGGGGGNGLSYEGIETQALITEENARELTVGAWLSGETGTQIDIFGVVRAESGSTKKTFSQMSLAAIFEEVADQIGTSVYSTGSYVGAVQTVTDTIYGYCGGQTSGSATIDGRADDETGAFTGSVTFNDYCEEDVTIKGKAKLSGTVDLNTEDLTDFMFTFRTLTIDEADKSITIDGSFSADYLAVPIHVTMSFVLKDNDLMQTYWLRDTQFQLDGGMDYVDIVGITGRYYDPQYGYVILSVGETIRIYDYANWPSGGSIILTGAPGTAGGNTITRLVFLNSNEYRVDADTDGDGAYDYTEGPYSWSDEIVLREPYIFSENTAYADFFNSSGYADSYLMRTIVRSDSPARSIYFQNNSSNEQIPYAPAIDLLSAPYFSYVKGFPPPNAPPGIAWEGREYTFFADENGNAALDSGEDFLQCRVPPGAIRQMTIPNVSVSGGSLPTISWQTVAYADNYQINFFEVSEQGLLGNLVFTVTIEEDGSASYSYTYDGDLFSQYTMLAIAVIAREENSSCVLNRSRYFTVHGM